MLEAALRARGPIPSAIAEAPVVNLGLELYLTAFDELSSARTIGMGEGPIPWTAVADWCRAHELGEDQAEDAQFYVRKLDNFYLEHLADRRSRDMRTQEKAAKAKTRKK